MLEKILNNTLTVEDYNFLEKNHCIAYVELETHEHGTTNDVYIKYMNRFFKFRQNLSAYFHLDDTPELGSMQEISQLDLAIQTQTFHFKE